MRLERAKTQIAIDVDQDYLVFQAPILTPKVSWLEIQGLRCRDSEFVRSSQSDRGCVP